MQHQGTFSTFTFKNYSHDEGGGLKGTVGRDLDSMPMRGVPPIKGQLDKI